MDSKLHTLHFIFNQKTCFHVPVWQRNYAWGKRQWGELWSDAIKTQQVKKVHYLGSAVVEPNGMLKFGDALKHTVVDGQQRLTTLTALFLAVRDQFPAHSNEWKSVQYGFILNSEVNPGSERRLRLQEGPNQVALSTLQDGQPTGDVPASRFLEAYTYFSTRMREELTGTAAVLDLASSVSQLFKITWTELQDGDNAHRVYQTINGNNVSLTPVDLIRNIFFLLLKHRGDDFYSAHWAPSVLSLQPEDQARFFDAWAQTQGHNATNPHLGIGADLLDLTVEEVFEYGVKVCRSARLFSLLVDDKRLASSTLTDSAKEALTWHVRWGIKPRPGLLLFLLQLWESSELSDAELVAALDVQASYLARRFLCGYATNLHRPSFDFALKDLTQKRPRGAAVADSIALKLSSLKEVSIWPGDAELRLEGPRATVYMTTRSKWVALTLATLNRGMHRNPNLAPKPSSLTAKQVEHVMPQKAESWKADLISWGVADPSEAHHRFLHTIGNLTLTSQNQALSNKRFSEKRVMFKDEKYALNDFILLTSVWTPEVIEQRAKSLVETAVLAFQAPRHVAENQKVLLVNDEEAEAEGETDSIDLD
jgi:hypothetical protein